jgi:hypothetical protein
MNKLFQILTLATLGLISQQSQSQSAQVSDNNRSEWVAQTATAGGRVRVTITKHKTRPQLHKTHRPAVRLFADDRDDDYYDELLEFQVGYRRPELVNQTAEVHHDISDEIKLRLLLARKRALEAYNIKWNAKNESTVA